MNTHKQSFSFFKIKGLNALILLQMICGMAFTLESPLPTRERPLILLLIGAPGSGKGTQSDLLASELNFVHVSAGDMIREHIQNNTEIGKRAAAYNAKGELAPDSLFIEMIQARLHEQDCSHGVILEGFPRTITQAKALDPILEGYQTRIVFLETTINTLLSRIVGRKTCPHCHKVYHMAFSPPITSNTCDNCHYPLMTRQDDTETIARRRIQQFYAQTVPVISYYQEKRLLRRLNGEQAIQKVALQIKDVLFNNEEPAPKKKPEALWRRPSLAWSHREAQKLFPWCACCALQ